MKQKNVHFGSCALDNAIFRFGESVSTGCEQAKTRIVRIYLFEL